MFGPSRSIQSGWFPYERGTGLLQHGNSCVFHYLHTLKLVSKWYGPKPRYIPFCSDQSSWWMDVHSTKSIAWWLMLSHSPMLARYSILWGLSFTHTHLLACGFNIKPYTTDACWTKHNHSCNLYSGMVLYTPPCKAYCSMVVSLCVVVSLLVKHCINLCSCVSISRLNLQYHKANKQHQPTVHRPLPVLSLMIHPMASAVLLGRPMRMLPDSPTYNKLDNLYPGVSVYIDVEFIPIWFPRKMIFKNWASKFGMLTPPLKLPPLKKRRRRRQGLHSNPSRRLWCLAPHRGPQSRPKRCWWCWAIHPNFCLLWWYNESPNIANLRLSMSFVLLLGVYSHF